MGKEVAKNQNDLGIIILYVNAFPSLSLVDVSVDVFAVLCVVGRKSAFFGKKR